MTLVLFATSLEASKTLEFFQPRLIQKSPFELYEMHNLLFAISGLGCFNAFFTISSLEKKIHHVVNFGIAGVKKRQNLNRLHQISSVQKYAPSLDPLSIQLHHEACPRIDFKKEGAVLISSDYPIRHSLDQTFDLVDMEGYGVAFACLKHHLKCDLLKYGSDPLTLKGRENLLKNLPEASHLFQKEIDKILFNDSNVS